MNLANWNVNVTYEQPQVIATAMADIAEKMVGAEYEFVAYLGSQVVNGINHAVLAKQTILSGRDTDNIVVMIFNEKPGDVKATLVNIERIIEGGMPMGGTTIILEKGIDAEAKAVWDDAFDGFVGSKLEPIMLLATQVANGTDYTFLAKVTPVASEAQAKVMLVTVNGLSRAVTFVDFLASRHDSALGYSFTW